MSDRRAAARLLGGLGPIFPTIKTVIADAGHQSRKLTRLIKAEGYELRIVKRRKRAFEVVGLTWIVERTFAWIGRYRRMSKDYEHRVQTSETLIDLIAIRLMLNRLTKSWLFKYPLSFHLWVWLLFLLAASLPDQLEPSYAKAITLSIRVRPAR